MKKVVIAGCGFVGSLTAKELCEIDCELTFCDKYKKVDGVVQSTDGHFDYAFICVDTPQGMDGRCDDSEVRNAITENDAGLYIIRSTIPPGTTDRLREEFSGKRIMTLPEYYGNTIHSKNVADDFAVLGGDSLDTKELAEFLQQGKPASYKFITVTATEAEIAKYMENCFLALKVSFCCEFWKLCEYMGASYNSVRNIFCLDPRVNPSHTFVYPEAPYWDTHCLNKDVAAITEEFVMPLMESVRTINAYDKKRFRKLAKSE